jgi:hypothetical protein
MDYDQYRSLSFAKEWVELIHLETKQVNEQKENSNGTLEIYM